MLTVNSPRVSASRPSTGLTYCWATAVFLLALTGCAERSGVDAPSAPATEAQDIRRPADPELKPYSKVMNPVTVTVPAGWLEIPPKNTIIAGEWQLMGTDGPARLTCTFAAGDIAGNLERWRAQFGSAPLTSPMTESSLEIAGQKATMLEGAGTFTDNFATENAVRPGSRLLGVVLPLDDQNFFIKVTGPEQTVLKHRDEILEFARSIRLKSK